MSWTETSQNRGAICVLVHIQISTYSPLRTVLGGTIVLGDTHDNGDHDVEDVENHDDCRSRQILTF